MCKILSKKKYYAVKIGRSTGIFDTWEDCKKEIEGYSGAIYKSFSNYEDAERFLNGDEKNELNNSLLKNSIKAYVDGSYSKTENKYSYGCVILCDDKTIKFGGVDDNIDYVEMKNVAGELLGSIEAIKWAKENNYDSITIYHDYEGIERWANGNWKANKKGTIEYVEFIEEYRNWIEIEFIKVKAHSGDIYNEEADKIAKEFLGKNIERKCFKSIDVDKQKYFELFNKIMNSEPKSKNIIHFKYNNYLISENKLKKYVKEIWSLDGRDKNDIDMINLCFNFNNSTLEWSIKTKAGKLEHFKFKI